MGMEVDKKEDLYCKKCKRELVQTDNGIDSYYCNNKKCEFYCLIKLIKMVDIK